jgi:hypothetical protein
MHSISIEARVNYYAKIHPQHWAARNPRSWRVGNPPRRGIPGPFRRLLKPHPIRISSTLNLVLAFCLKSWLHSADHRFEPSHAQANKQGGAAASPHSFSS